MDADKYIFTTIETAEFAKDKADAFWIDQIYTGDEDYIPQGSIIAVTLEDGTLNFDWEKKDDMILYYVIVNEYFEYMVSNVTCQWELVS
jgi:hypothetical protein